MAAALPHIDAFISGHSADALAEVVHTLATTSRSSRFQEMGQVRAPNFK
jgi:hypothetical protein